MKLWLSWSSGKDSAWALHRLRQQGEHEVVGLFTTVNEVFGRVAMHGARQGFLERQARLLGLPLRTVPLPWPCTNSVYEQRMAALYASLGPEVDGIAFGDIFLEDIRRYRVDHLDGTGLHPVFPLWKEPTRALAETMIDAGLEAYVVCVDPKQVPAELAGRRFDWRFLDDLPEGADPCGENGEYHTLVVAGPGFPEAIPARRGVAVEREGFVYADIVPV